MSKPPGVTASAIVAILGSTIIMVFGSLMIVALFVEPPKGQPSISVPLGVAVAALYIILAGIGIRTAIGLFRLQPWARTSMIVFAGFLGVIGIVGLLMTIVAPMPTRSGQGFRGGLAAVFAIPLAISVWWLIQFNTPSTKAAFGSPATGGSSARPASITIIAWMMIAGGVSCVFAIFARAPLFLLGATLTDSMAGVMYAVFGAVSFFIGKGLLDLREEARILGIGWSGISIAHMGLITLVPPLRQRLLEMQRALTPNEADPMSFDVPGMLNLSFVVSAALGAAAIWFLIRTRDAFGREPDGAR
jgi:hypothetical protein